MCKLWCTGQWDFDEMIRNNGMSLPENSVAISIIGTKSVLEKYLDESDTTHILPDSEDVLNLEFDDIARDRVDRGDVHAIGISNSQAIEIVKFLEKAVESGKDIYVHCRAGRSRSQAIVRYVKSRWPGPWRTNEMNPDNTPNYYVLGRLRDAEKSLEGLS